MRLTSCVALGYGNQLHDKIAATTDTQLLLDSVWSPLPSSQGADRKMSVEVGFLSSIVIRLLIVPCSSAAILNGHNRIPRVAVLDLMSRHTALRPR